MTTEEKAKAYDEAIQRAKEILEIGVKDSRDKKVILSFFPELKESEDEKIRKAIINEISLKEREAVVEEQKAVYQSWISWLEKQGQQKSSSPKEPRFRVGCVVKSKSQPMLKPRKITLIGEDCYYCDDCGCIGFACEDDYEIVEPKELSQSEVTKISDQEWSEEDEELLKNGLNFDE